jgi:hypothetical protein
VVDAVFLSNQRYRKDSFNRFMQFLDKGSKTYFKRGALLLWLGHRIYSDACVTLRRVLFFIKKVKLPIDKDAGIKGKLYSILVIATIIVGLLSRHFKSNTAIYWRYSLGYNGLLYDPLPVYQ